MGRHLTSRELARVLGVSESSVKRWVDDGTIRATRTAGGHRRIARADAIRFIRTTRAPVLAPELLGLPDVAATLSDQRSSGRENERLLDYLVAGSSAEARGLIQALYLQGENVASIIDGHVRVAMERIGELWLERPDGIFIEHRATDICIHALGQLRGTFPSAAQGPVALGGAPGGDPYLLPSLAISIVLAEDGYQAINLGPNTPFDTLRRAAEDLRPRLVWVTVGSLTKAEVLEQEVTALAAAIKPLGSSLTVGGRGAARLRHSGLEHLHLGGTMAELSAFARGLLRT
ncbi:MAG: excisionase family DNA-binding protein [Thermoanaerobaculaceae bacterium]|jgi:excisionase family DNA binding protein|nr:excisionase family DNA-binding protein [Thermoanaerobaculaceae bacterium]